ncbi:MAG TPA: DUF5977 domain-containing protein [Flavisolibacter sp.]|nr:DUF5977 domain-containing protein [Flavisolibacter sp.]
MKKIGFFLAFAFASLSAYCQVNLQTGSATFSLPVFNWQDNKSRLTTVIALNYNSGSGLRVNDVASNVGQGWSLVAGGVVTRVQVGEPDDQMPYGTSASSDIKKYPAGYLYASTPASKGCPAALTKYPIYGHRNQLYKQHNSIAEDRQLDMFTFQFNGKTGMFLLNTKNGDYGESIGESKIKISFQRNASVATNNSSGVRTSITSFTIQDEDGLIYRFTQRGFTKVLKSAYCDQNLVQSQTQPKFENNKVYNQTGFDEITINPWITNSWYLTEIEDPFLHTKVLFNYIIRNVNSRAGQDFTYNEGDKNYVIITHRRSITQTPEISSITYPDGHSVVFSYGSTSRYDLSGEYPLAEINVSYKGRYLSRYKLNTSYFILNRYGTPTSDYQKRVSRLCLKSVQKVGVDLKEENLPYIFDYYLGSNTTDDFVPPPFFYMKDVWGHYNGSNNKGWVNNESIPLDATVLNLNYNQLKGLCFLRKVGSNTVFEYYNPKQGYAKNGLLRQIVYPTGGTLTYHYEQNTGFVGGAVRQVGGIHVNKTSSTDGNFSNGCNNPLSTTYNYILANGQSSLWGLEDPQTSLASYNHYKPEVRKYKWSFPFGSCYWKFQYPGILSQQQSMDLPNWVNTLNAIGPFLGVISTISTIAEIITVCTGGNPVTLIITLVIDLIQLVFTCFGSNEKNKTVGIYHSFDLRAGNPLPVQFKRVEVIENPGTRGKVVQVFSSDDDYPLWEPSNPNFVPKQRFAPWAYGLPRFITTFDASGNKVKEVENEYDFNRAKSLMGFCTLGHGMACDPNPTGLSTKLISCQCTVVKNSSQREDKWSDPAIYNDPNSYTLSSSPDMTADYYGYYSGRVNLITSKERIYKQGDQTKFLETVTAFSYRTPYSSSYSNGEMFQKSVTLSNGDKEDYTYVYSNEINEGVYSTLTANNVWSIPIVVNAAKIKAGVGYGYKQTNVTEYSSLSNGDIKPWRKLQGRTDQFVAPYSFSWPFYHGPSSTDYSKFNVVETYTYDSYGNLTGITDEGKRNVRNIFGYDDKYIVASVINAENDGVAYANFEAGAGMFGWGNQNSSLTSYLTIPVTGKSCLYMQSGAMLYAVRNRNKNYIVSYWASGNPNIIVANASLAKTYYGVNGFTYYEWELGADPSGSFFTYVSGTGLIDDLRLYPKSARMRTVTYDPLLGKTAECDENNRITFYEYDASGRIAAIKDEKKTIVKMYEYNSISPAKQNGCPGIYYNRLISEKFTKSNCGPGYMGTEYTVTVPANAYTSALSQADADAQADEYLQANGQNLANTYGSCIPVYYNAAASRVFTTESCAPGYIGGTVTYTVPANKYYSLVSQAEADQMAQDDIDANGDAYANDPANANCTISYDPEWSAEEDSPTDCRWVNGEAHIFRLFTDINPNSASYGSTSWLDTGEPGNCLPPNNCDLSYTNNTGEWMYITLTDVNTWQSYYFYASPWVSGILGSVPSGNYNIQISPSSGWYWYTYSLCNSYYNYGYPDGYFYNTYLGCGCDNIYIMY